MPGRLMLRAIGETHKFWYRLTGGRLGGGFGKIRFLLLTTTGRKSGRPWTTPLSYMADGDDMVVIASNGGSDRHPAWYLNLRANPQVTVEAGARKFTATAETVSRGEKDLLWPRIVEMYPGYDNYQRGTKREIPVVRLHAEAR